MAQSEVEPNNGFAQAQPVIFDQTITGAVDPTGDEDFFQVQVTTPGVLEARLLNIPNGEVYEVSIFNAQQQEIAQQSGSETNPAFTNRLVCTPGTYYIKVNEVGNNSSNSSQYQLTVVFDASDIQECNNSFDDATPVTFGTVISASIFDTGDRDYYSINVTEPGVIEALLADIPSNRTYRVTIFNSLQQSISDDSGNETNPAFANRLVCEPGLYFVMVNESGDNASSPDPYQLTISFDNSDPNECNNSFSTATPIEFDETQTADIFDTGDQDYYSVTVESPGVIEILLSDIPGSQVYWIDLFNPLQQEISDDSGSATNPAMIRRLLCEPGTYFIRVSESGNNASSTTPYQLTVSFNSDDAYECNNTFGAATPINPCLPLQANILPAGDQDCFDVSVSEAGDYSLSITNVPGNISFDAKVFDEFGSEIADNSNPAPGASVLLDFTINNSGIYTVCIDANSSSAFSESLYTLTFNGIPCNPVAEICANGLDDDGDGSIDCEDGDCADFLPCNGSVGNCNLSLSTTNLINAVCSEPTGEVTIVPSGGIPTYSCNLSGPTPGTIQNDGAGVFTDLAPGSYTADVTDGEGCTASIDFVIGNDGAVAASSINSNVSGLTVDFSFDTSILVEVNSILWDFGDGTTSTDTLPTHTYAAEGTYTVTLTLNSIECGPGVTQGTVTVSGGGTTAPAPEAGFEPSTTLGCAPLTVTFDNTSVNAVAYQWIIDGVTPSLYTTEDPGPITFTQPGFYTVRLEAENADGVEDVTEVTIEVQQVPVADFNAQVSGTTVSITNLSFPATSLIDQISWNFGDGNTSSSASSGFSHVYAAPGIYTITLSLTNECGSDEIAKSVIVEPNAGQISLDVGENMGFEGQVVPVPVILREYTGTLAALQGTLEFETAGVAEFQGFSGNLINAGNIQFNDANGQFSALAPNGLQASGGADTLFFVNVLLSGNPGDSTDIFINDDPSTFTRLEVTIFENGAIGTINNILLIDGQVKIFESADLDGLIYFWEDLMTPVNLVDVNLDFAGTPVDPDSTQTTGPSGTYFFDNVDAGEDVVIYCVKETNPVNGVTTGPLFLVQQYTVLGPGPVGQYNSPYQMVASDSDCNETINAADIIRVQQVIVGNPNVDLCKSWTFVPEYYTELTDFNMNNQGFVLTYPEEVSVNQIQDDTTFNFVGVKVGDILGNADPSSLMDDGPIEVRNSASIKLQLKDRAVQAGDFFELALTSNGFQDMGGLQLALEYAADELEFHGFVEASQAIQPQFYHDEEMGSLRLSWVDPSATGLSLDEDTPVLTLRFKALNSANAINDLLWINTNTMRAEATDVNLGQYQVELEWEALTNNPVAGQQAGYYLYQNVPNPAKEETRIKFSLPFAQRARLDLIDPLGRVVASYEQLFPQGFSELNISTQQLQSGLYQYRLRTEAYTEAKTMMIVR
jgi:PKD repeat protein